MGCRVGGGDAASRRGSHQTCLLYCRHSRPVSIANSCWDLSLHVQACPEDGGEAPKEALQKVVRQFGSDGNQELPGRLGMGAVGGGHADWYLWRAGAGMRCLQWGRMCCAAWRVACVLQAHSQKTKWAFHPSRMPPVLRTGPQTRSPLTSWRSRCTAAAATPRPRRWTARARAPAAAWPWPRMTPRVGRRHRDGGAG